jgi:hypothetical protein
MWSTAAHGWLDGEADVPCVASPLAAAGWFVVVLLLLLAASAEAVRGRGCGRWDFDMCMLVSGANWNPLGASLA